MNKLITLPDGGFPYVLDDIRWEQDAYRNALISIAKAVRNSATLDSILWGCNVTDNTTTFDVSAGAVIIDGEIHEVAAATGLVKAASKTLYIAASTGTYDAGGLKTYQDATTHDAYEIRKAVVAIGIVPGGQINLSTTGAGAIPLKKERLFNNYVGACDKTVLADATLDDTGSYQANYSGATVPLTYWKRGNMVEFEGGIKHNAGVTPAARTHVATFPTGYRPNAITFIYGYSYGADLPTLFEIGTDGKLYVRGDILGGSTINTTTGVVLTGSFAI